MIRAGIIVGGFADIVIARDGLMVAAERVEVGQLVPDPDGPKRGYYAEPMRRDITPADIQAAAYQIAGILATHGVEHTTIAIPRSKGAHRATTLAILDALRHAGLAVVPAQNWANKAGGVEIRGVAAGAPRAIRLPASLLAATSAGPVSHAATTPDAGPYVPEDEPERRERTVLTPTTPAPVAPAPRPPVTARIGIDPGSTYVGLVVLLGAAPPFRCAMADTVRVGELVPLAQPKGGQTHRWAVTGDHVARVADHVRDVCREHGVTRAVLEHVEQVYLPKDGPGNQSIATAINRTTWVEGEIRATLRAVGVECAQVTRTAWRGRLLPPRRGDTTEGLREAIAAHVEGYPRDADEHAADACGVALADALPEREAPAGRKRATQRRGEKRERMTWAAIKGPTVAA